MSRSSDLSVSELRWRYFRGKAAEDAALAALRRFSTPWVGRLAHSVLARVHRDALEALAGLPAIPADEATGRLGVRPDRTLVVPYDPVWPVLFAAEARLLRRHLGDRGAELHHIGSTAVPGLAAKPILDIAVGLPSEGFDEEVAAAIGALRRLGYRYLGNRRGLGGHFLEKGPWPVRTHAVQLHPAGGRELARLLRFRALLRANPPLAGEYQAIKQALAARSGGDRRLYLWYKAHWVNGLLLETRESRAWGNWLTIHAPPSLCRMHWRRWPRRRPGSP
jgi:GrpB-like predicted nucleotidyltransferase (UPF0157 family)